MHERGPHGVFAVHGYPIGDRRVAPSSSRPTRTSWRAAGLDEFDVTAAARAQRREVPRLPGGALRRADRRAPAAGQQLALGQLPHPAHAPLAAPGRRSAIALLGDAVHTAHFSVGSGTKMAMEDAVALVAALDAHPGGTPADVDAALAEYEAVRLPQVARIQDSARPSLVVVGALRPLPRRAAALAVRLPLLLPQHHRRASSAAATPPSSAACTTAGGPSTAPSRWTARSRSPGSGSPAGSWRSPTRTALLPGGPLPLREQPPGDGGPWGLLGRPLPTSRPTCPGALAAVGAGVAAGPALVAVTGRHRAHPAAGLRGGPAHPRRGQRCWSRTPRGAGGRRRADRRPLRAHRPGQRRRRARDRRARARRGVSRLDPLFAPRGIAVVGASRDPAKLGAVMARSLQGFAGPRRRRQPPGRRPGGRPP